MPAEIAHLMEEIQAKDKIIQECRSTIHSRDNSLQKFIKLNGSLTPNPKEEPYSKTVLQNLDRCQSLQDEKILLSEKACVLLDRQIKKLDVKIRDLQNEGILSTDPARPSLLDNKDQARDLPKAFFPDMNSNQASTTVPLNPTSGNSNSAFSNAAQRVNQPPPRIPNPSALNTQGGRNSAPSTPSAASLHFQQRQRESSAGAVDNKRRRLNASLGTLPAAPSNLRQSSLGPGTPKASTPGANRAGSVGPRACGAIKKPMTKKVAPHQQVKKIKAGLGANGKPVKRSSGTSNRVKLSTGVGGVKKTESNAGGDDDEEDSVLSSADVSESENASLTRRAGAGNDSDEEAEEEEDEGGEDTKVYCTCRTVSHGDMVACDNDNCPYEWFHWKCVGLTREPLGKWYCEECRKTLGM